MKALAFLSVFSLLSLQGCPIVNAAECAEGQYPVDVLVSSFKSHGVKSETIKGEELKVLREVIQKLHPEMEVADFDEHVVLKKSDEDMDLVILGLNGCSVAVGKIPDAAYEEIKRMMGQQI